MPGPASPAGSPPARLGPAPPAEITCEIDASCEFDIRIRRSKSHNASKSHINPPRLSRMRHSNPTSSTRTSTRPDATRTKPHTAPPATRNGNRKPETILLELPALPLTGVTVRPPATPVWAHRCERAEHAWRGTDQKYMGPGTRTVTCTMIKDPAPDGVSFRFGEGGPSGGWQPGRVRCPRAERLPGSR